MRALVVCLCLAATGCASITAGTTQTIAVSTAPKSGANCDLANEKGHWSVNPTPGSTTITKAYGDLTITCADSDGEKGATAVQSKTAGAVFGNILFGGIIGAAVDMSSGAAYLYPSTATVTLAPVPAVATVPDLSPKAAPETVGKPQS